MPSLIETYQSARGLQKQLQKMLDALNREYDPFPDDPSNDFFVAASNSIMYMRGILMEISQSDRVQISGLFAINFAIEMDDLGAFKNLISKEIADIKVNDPLHLTEFIDQVRALVAEKHPLEQWLQILHDK